MATDDLSRRVAAVRPKILLRPHGPGDMGWILHRHAVLYFQEYGWKEDFEALVAEIVAKFIRHYDPAMERCWIAEHNGEIAGSVTLVKQSKSIAKLRMLYVEPSARGLGVGGRLVDECIRFARSCGYRKMVLLTDSLLHASELRPRPHRPDLGAQAVSAFHLGCDRVRAHDDSA